MITFSIEGTPVGKARPRLSRYGTYTPTKTKNYEELVRTTVKNMFGDFIPLEGALEVRIIAVFEVPKSYSKKKKRELIGKEQIFKPDADNISKIILDSLNGLVYKDDSQVAKLNVHKIYGEKAEVTVIIEKI